MACKINNYEGERVLLRKSCLDVFLRYSLLVQTVDDIELQTIILNSTTQSSHP
jgi:hypothetical protein